MGADIAVFREFFRYNPDTRHRKRQILALLKGLEFRSLLDLGCGDGNLCEAIKEAFPGVRVVGADISEAAVAANRAAPGARCEYIALDATRGPIPEQFDVVLSSEVLEHIDRDDLAVESIRAMCRRWFLVTVPAGKVYETSQLMGHHRHYTPETLTGLLEPRGFRVVRLYAWGFPFHSLYRWAINLRAKSLWESFTRDHYSATQVAVCHLLYGLFFLNSGRAGDQLYCLAENRS